MHSNIQTSSRCGLICYLGNTVGCQHVWIGKCNISLQHVNKLTWKQDSQVKCKNFKTVVKLILCSISGKSQSWSVPLHRIFLQWVRGLLRSLGQERALTVINIYVTMAQSTRPSQSPRKGCWKILDLRPRCPAGAPQLLMKAMITETWKGVDGGKAGRAEPESCCVNGLRWWCIMSVCHPCWRLQAEEL